MDYFVDTETTNGLDYPIVYDFGGEGLDGSETINDIVFETFFNDKLMESAYYADKIPQYREDMWNSERFVENFFALRSHIHALYKAGKIKRIFAHNAAFDIRALNNTCKVLSKGKIKYFFPYGMEICDTLKQARQILWHSEEYWNYCKANGYMTNHPKPKPRLTAEIIYRFITNNHAFEEAHTGLADVRIEKQIYEYLFALDPTADVVLYHARA